MALPKKIIARKDEITADFLQLYEQHLAELFAGKASHRMTSSKFAEKLFIHPGHLTNTIKLTTGKSPCDFMEEGIAAEAQRLLEQTDMHVADIAMKFAYDEPTNFIKFFKGMTGMTPLQYRKLYVSQEALTTQP